MLSAFICITDSICDTDRCSLRFHASIRQNLMVASYVVTVQQLQTAFSGRSLPECCVGNFAFLVVSNVYPKCWPRHYPHSRRCAERTRQSSPTVYFWHNVSRHAHVVLQNLSATWITQSSSIGVLLSHTNLLFATLKPASLPRLNHHSHLEHRPRFCLLRLYHTRRSSKSRSTY
ncbi:uncharacterized protein EI90DRAFT_3088401 [Cantharellus anzutake]|uniref:uncharacterized protein n=1 Tax=Cantharellus anzutake TaxID=1750568 RepID=UPI0019068226|nr:uncharacterized protein EI90DRAFT_3088401 [Cantharellus anzutake]KAF8315272.1 hypothetical protein EI90DRAFT_3088401 [Cantharellus anzutake]